MLDLNKFTVYVVGGYVRDRLLGLDPQDHDFVVIGATPEDMLQAGFSQVGADFPVFLEPKTGDEYALARTERKSGPGYHGFDVDFSTEVTLEEDLFRRDLTINAMARQVLSWNEEGHAHLSDDIVDPFNGQQDLANKLLNPVSKHFKDDPVRVLRACRFRARYGFSFSKNFLDQGTELAINGELYNLTAERVWAETWKALHEPNPFAFFESLTNVNGLVKIFEVLDEATLVDPQCVNDPDIRLMMLTSSMTPTQCAKFFDDLKAPVQAKNRSVNLTKAIRLVAPYEGETNAWTPELLMQVLEAFNLFRDPLALPDIKCVLFRLRNRMLSPRLIKQAFLSVRDISFADLSEDEQANLKGKEISDRIREYRVHDLSIILDVFYKLANPRKTRKTARTRKSMKINK